MTSIAWACAMLLSASTVDAPSVAGDDLPVMIGVLFPAEGQSQARMFFLGAYENGAWGRARFVGIEKSFGDRFNLAETLFRPNAEKVMWALLSSLRKEDASFIKVLPARTFHAIQYPSVEFTLRKCIPPSYGFNGLSSNFGMYGEIRGAVPDKQDGKFFVVANRSVRASEMTPLVEPKLRDRLGRWMTSFFDRADAAEIKRLRLVEKEMEEKSWERKIQKDFKDPEKRARIMMELLVNMNNGGIGDSGEFLRERARFLKDNGISDDMVNRCDNWCMEQLRSAEKGPSTSAAASGPGSDKEALKVLTVLARFLDIHEKKGRMPACEPDPRLFKPVEIRELLELDKTTGTLWVHAVQEYPQDAIPKDILVRERGSNYPGDAVWRKEFYGILRKGTGNSWSVLWEQTDLANASVYSRMSASIVGACDANGDGLLEVVLDCHAHEYCGVKLLVESGGKMQQIVDIWPR